MAVPGYRGALLPVGASGRLGRVLKVAQKFSMRSWVCSILGMRRRFELSDEQWASIGSKLPPERGRKARPARDNRRMVNAMLWVLRTGAPWRDLPAYYPPWKTVYTRFSRWTLQGLWQHVLTELTKDADPEGYLIDGTTIRAHQDAHGARKGGRPRLGAHAEVHPARSTL
jgi:transposase